MGVYIPNMEKPKSCGDCRYKMWTMNETFCNLLDKMLGDEGIRPDCPLIEIDLVRCGECKHWDGIECQNDRASIDLEGGAEYALYRDDTDFCSYGERRTDDL